LIERAKDVANNDDDISAASDLMSSMLLLLLSHPIVVAPLLVHFPPEHLLVRFQGQSVATKLFCSKALAIARGAFKR
jgi:hypothetical protein